MLHGVWQSCIVCHSRICTLCTTVTTRNKFIMVGNWPTARRRLCYEKQKAGGRQHFLPASKLRPDYCSGARASQAVSVAAVVASRQNRINQTCRCCSRGARVRTTQLCNGGSKAGSPRGGIGYFRGDNRTDRTNRRCFIGGDAGAKQVRNCDSCDDQNNRHHDEQLDK